MAHELNQVGREMLMEANHLLTTITESHDLCCECVWCEARMLTDCQDEAFFTAQDAVQDEEAKV